MQKMKIKNVQLYYYSFPVIVKRLHKNDTKLVGAFVARKGRPSGLTRHSNATFNGKAMESKQNKSEKILARYILSHYLPKLAQNKIKMEATKHESHVFWRNLANSPG